MTVAEIKAMMARGSSLSRAPGPFESALAGSRQGACLAKRSGWDAWGGQAKKSARAAAASMGLRFERDPDDALCGPGVLAIFPLDPGPLPPPSPDSAQAEEALSALLDERIAAALAKGRKCGAFAIALCGWGPRAPMAEARAREAGLVPLSLD